MRKEKAKQEKIAREQAEKYLRKHNAGGINDLWYKKLRELKARKKAGARVAWTKKENGSGDDGGVPEEEDVGLEVEMLPEHLVKALKAKYETENAEEALNKALKEEEEGKGTILSEVMADLDAEEENSDIVERTDGDEKKADEQDEAAVTEANEEEPVADDDESSGEAEKKIDESPIKNDNEMTESEHVNETPVEEEPVEEVRSKIEQLSIEDPQSNSFQEKKGVDSKESVEEETNDKPATEKTTEPKEQTEQIKLFYNVQNQNFFTGDSGTVSEDVVDLSDPNQRGKLDEEQATQMKEQLIALQDQIKDLLASC